MIVFESIKLALQGIWAHKARSFLTMLGIIIGISLVVTLMSLGEGVKNDVKKTVQGLGTNIAFVLSGNIKINNSGGTGGGMGIPNPANLISGDILKRTDVDAIKQVPGVQTAVAITLVPGTVKQKDVVAAATVMGTDLGIGEIFTGIHLQNGRFLEQPDQGKNVVVIGYAAKQTLFGDNESLGKKITIGKEEFEVVGSLSKPASTGGLGSNELETITLIPFDTATKINNNEVKIFRIGIKIKDGYDTKNVTQDIENNMLLRHSQDDFSVFTQDDILNSLSSILNMLTLFISAIAAISLIVGGVGIMNIMLVSVTERTREIGLRKAVGATNGIILLQFLIEAVIISLVGGLISIGIVRIITWIIEIKTTLTPFITLQSIILALGVCVAVGIVFGLAPAIGAARKDPIEALRYK